MGELLFFNKRTPGKLWGGPDAPVNKLVLQMGAAISRFADRAADLRASSGRMLNSEVKKHGDATRVEFMAAMEDAAKAIKAARESLTLRMATVNAARDYKQMHFHEVLIERELVDHLRKMDPIPHAALVHQMLANPMLHLTRVEALLHTPQEISTLSWQEHQALRVALFAAMKPADYAVLEIERRQIDTAQNTLLIAATECKETTGHQAPFAIEAPTAHELLGAQSLAWVDASIDQRYVPEPELADA